jgi:hypothetical protein
MEELPAVAALRRLSIFGPDQAGAYREHYADLAAVFGPDVESRLVQYLRRWGRSGEPGVCILTGNAGTGKTAAAQSFAEAVGGQPPPPGRDDLMEVARGRWVAKDLSGIGTAEERLRVMEMALGLRESDQVLVCANEGVLRDAVEALRLTDVAELLEEALRLGAARLAGVLIVNANRQRPTAPGFFEDIIGYVTRPELWGGCDGCPQRSAVGDSNPGCPFIDNAEALRKTHVQTALRRLVQLATGDAVPTLREVLAILARAVTGGSSCQVVKDRARERGARDLHADLAYYSLGIGNGLSAEVVGRSPLLSAMRNSGLGLRADLEVDKWLRDATAAPEGIGALAAALAPDATTIGDLDGSASHLDRVPTEVGTMTYFRLGETISTSEDPDRVDAGIQALVRPRAGVTPALSLWRARVYFEGNEALGGSDKAAARLLRYKYFPELLSLAGRIAAGGDAPVELSGIVAGLNFLVTGFSSANEGLVVPDPSCLFARNPGSFRPAQPSLVQSQVQLDRIRLGSPDSGLVEELLDIDHIEILLVVDGDPALGLRIGPRMFEAISEAAKFQGPVGPGTAEMTDLRSFYGRLAAHLLADGRLRVADPDATPPALITISLPAFEHR